MPRSEFLLGTILCGCLFGSMAAQSEEAGERSQRKELRRGTPRLMVLCLRLVRRCSPTIPAITPIYSPRQLLSTDLIPDFRLSLNDGEATEGGALKKIALTYSPTVDRIVDLGITVAVEDPDLYGGFDDVMALSDQQWEMIGSELGLGDSWSVNVTASLIGKVGRFSFGRSIGLYQSELNGCSTLRWMQISSALQRSR